MANRFFREAQEQNANEVDWSSPLYDFEAPDIENLVSKCAKITSLKLSFGHDDWIKPLKNLTKLRQLSLHNFDLSSEGYKLLASLKGLVLLDLSNCRIKDKDLKILIPLEKLENLILFGDELTNIGLDLLQKFPHLTSLSLSGSQITDSGMKHIMLLDKLEKFIFEDSFSITAKGLAYLEPLKNLNHLLLSKAHLSKQGFAIISTFQKLRYLSLRQCSDSGENQSVVELKRLNDLLYLDLSFCQLNDASLQALTSLKKLESLELCHCKNLTNEVCRYLGSFLSLIQLNLEHNEQITDEGLSQLHMDHLNDLNLSACLHISDNGLKALSRLKNLKRLHLYKCERITDEGLSFLAHLPHLSYLNVKLCPKISMEMINFFKERNVNIEYTEWRKNKKD